MHELSDIDIVVIGAGVIGLGIARELALAGREVAVLEAERALGLHTSGRNSGVIHAGIYYRPGSLKAALCVRGKVLLYDYARTHGVEHARLGKMIVATSEHEIPTLARLHERARANGVADLSWLDARELAALEPELSGVRALLSPSTGIIDSHGLLAAFKRDALEAGAALVFGCRVTAGRVRAPGIELDLEHQPDLASGIVSMRCRWAINAAGLGARGLAAAIDGVHESSLPRAAFSRGQYFALAGHAPFSRLVYPVPVPGGLGVHFTLDTAGTARFGPDVAPTDRIDYAFDESRAPAFYAAIRRYYPALADGGLLPGYCGIRPKLVGTTGEEQDFVVQTSDEHGVPGLVNLFGIESPGLTASLSLAKYVRAIIERA